MTSLRRFLLGKPLSWLVVSAAAAILGAGVPAVAAAKKPHKSKKAVGRVYTETNDPTGNKVLIFDRFANGKLKEIGTIGTGGKGGFQPQPGCLPICPFLDTQNAVGRTPDGKLLFVVNAGSSTITSFRATSTGLTKVSVVPTNGTSGSGFPNSLTIHRNWLYVLNSDSDNIAGFKFTPTGHLRRIGGSSQALVGGALPGVPRQIGFDNTGHLLMVTLLANAAGPLPAGGTANTIDTFPVNAAGVAGAGNANSSTAPLPFAFAFDGRDHAIIAEPNAPANGMVGSFKLTHPLGISPVDLEPTKGNAPCWVEITGNSRYAYLVNTGGGSPTGSTVSEFSVSPRGKLTLIGITPALNEFLDTDELLSSDSRYLYVASPLESGSKTAPGSTSHIDEYRVQRNGTLKLIGSTGALKVPAISGLAGT